MNKLACLTILSLGIAITLVSSIYLSELPEIIEKQIEKGLIITNGSEAYSKFIHPKIPITFKVFIFDISNAGDILNEWKPQFIEHGPYTFSELREKKIDKFKKNGNIIQFHEKKLFFFEPNQSNGSLDDQVTIVNVSALTVMATSTKSIRNQMLTHESGLFMKRSVRQILFDSETSQDNDKESTFFKGMNGSYLGPFEINSGAENIDDFTLLTTKQFANSRSVLDGFSFPPNLKSSSIYRVFSSLVYRSFPIIFKSEERLNGIKVGKFVTLFTRRSNQFNCTELANATNNNQLKLHCGHLSKYTLSLPCFNSNNLTGSIDRLSISPNSNSESYFYIEPVTGQCLKSAQRFQYSINLTTIEGSKNLIIPVIWFEESFEITGDESKKIKSNIVDRFDAIDGLLLTLMIFGTILVFFGLVLFFFTGFETGELKKLFGQLIRNQSTDYIVWYGSTETNVGSIQSCKMKRLDKSAINRYKRTSKQWTP